jgi:predicted Zn-dependent peptidase
MIYTFLKSHYDPSRMVLAGVGVDHDALVECAQKYGNFKMKKYFSNERNSNNFTEFASGILLKRNLSGFRTIR